MRLLSLANFSVYGESNTALHRHRALCKVFYDQVDKFETSFNYGFINKVINKLFNKGLFFSFIGTRSLNERLILQVKNNNYDIIWIDKGIAIKEMTLKRIKLLNPNILIVGYSPDEMTQRHNQSKDFLSSLPYYDAYITTKSYAVEDLKKLGAKKVYFVNNAFEPSFHYPRHIVKQDINILGGEIGFIGMWEEARANSILYLAKKGLNVRVWGAGKWLEYKNLYPNLIIENKALFSEEYSIALGSFKINLCFLRKINFDQQTTRSIEIPASGGFMLAERTTEHLNLFEEDVEAAFFSNDEELYNKCKFYLENDDIRKKMMQAAYLRCKQSGYSNEMTLKNVIYKIVKDLKHV